MLPPVLVLYGFVVAPVRPARPVRRWDRLHGRTFRPFHRRTAPGAGRATRAGADLYSVGSASRIRSVRSCRDRWRTGSVWPGRPRVPVLSWRSCSSRSTWCAPASSGCSRLQPRPRLVRLRSPLIGRAGPADPPACHKRAATTSGKHALEKGRNLPGRHPARSSRAKRRSRPRTMALSLASTGDRGDARWSGPPGPRGPVRARGPRRPPLTNTVGHCEALSSTTTEATLLAERAYPPDHVAGRSLCLRWVGHGRLLGSEGGGQGLQVQLARNRYHGDDQAGGGCGDEGLQDSLWLCPERLRCLPAVGGRRVVGVFGNR